MVAATLAAFALMIPAPAGASNEFPALDQAAAQLVGHPVKVICETPDEWAADPYGGGRGVGAYSYPGSGPIVLSPRICGMLVVAYQDPPGVYDLLNANVLDLEGQSFLALAHEAGHVRLDTTDEHAAECFGLAHARDLMQGWNLPDTRANQEIVAAQEHDRYLYGGSVC